jgi:hypothetical protein
MEEARIWLEKSLEDFDTAEFNRNDNRYSYAAFLYQQQHKGLPKTHDCQRGSCMDKKKYLIDLKDKLEKKLGSHPPSLG